MHLEAARDGSVRESLLYQLLDCFIALHELGSRVVLALLTFGTQMPQ